MSVPSEAEIRRRQREDFSHIQGYAHIMTGGQGTVSLFMDVDENGNIRNRAIMKDSYMDQAHWDQLPLVDGMPIEIATCYALESPKTVKIHGDTVLPERRMYRMHLEYEPHGDLFDLLERYVSKGRMLPEAFIWYVAKSMTEVGILMQQGDLDTPKTPWRALIHRDIKPDNMVLGPPLTTEFPSYPTPKMMDFGHVIEYYPDNPMPQRDQCRGGTTCFNAPERTGDHRGPMTPASDVYSLGCSLYHLMNGTGGEPIHFDDDGQPTFLADDEGSRYTEYLQEVALFCMRTDYRERPTFLQLRERMAELFETPSEDLELQRITALSTRTVQQADRWIPMSLEELYELDYQKDDQYRIGSACNFVDPVQT